MTRRFAKIEQDLANLLDQQLLTDIYAFREKRLSRIEGILQNMSQSLSDTNEISKTIGYGIKQLQAFSKTDECRTISEILVTDIFALKEGVPKRKTFPQPPERFQILDDDTLYVKAGKAVKQLLRQWGKSGWMQKVPFQNVLTYHLLDADWFFKDWLAAEERLRMQVALELDQVLANAGRGKLKHGMETELQQLLQVVQNHIQEAQRVHDQKLNEARATIIEQFVTVFSKVGTFEQRPGFYSRKRLIRKQKKTKKELTEYIEDWQHINKLQLERTAALHRVFVFCNSLEQATDRFKTNIRDIFEQIFFNPYHELEKKIDAVRREAVSAEQDLFSVFANNEQELLSSLEPNLLNPLHEYIESDQIQNHVDLYAEQLIQRADELPESVIFITNIDRGEDPPKIESKNVRWRGLVSGSLKEKVLNRIRSDKNTIEDFNHKQLEELQEIKEIIEVSMESASALIRKPSPQEDPYEVVDEALQRADKKIKTRVNQAKEVEAMLLEPLQKELDEFKHTIFDLLYSADMSKLQKLNANYQMSEKKQEHGTKLKRADQLKNKGALAARFIRRKANKNFRQAGSWLGFIAAAPQKEEKADVAAYLSETERRYDELPYIYRQLFNFKTKPDEAHLVGMNEQISAAEGAYKQWKNGGTQAFAVVGEKGSGKSIFFDQVNKELFSNADVWFINVDQTCWTESALIALFNEQINSDNIRSVDDLITFLNSRQKETVILFEEMHNLYLRHINGYEGIEHLIYLISETSEKIFWAASCSRYAWAYLDEAIGLENYFSQVVKTDSLDEEQIKNVIMKRHQSSGYELVFESKKSDARSKNTQNGKSDEEKKQKHLKEEYFKELTELAEGNASVAMIFWIRSIRDFDDTHLYVAPLETASLKILDDLQPEAMFVLAALVLHDTLSSGELSAVLGMPEKESKLIFNRLKAKDILAANGNSMGLNQQMYRQTIRELKKRNIIHLS